MKSNLLSPFYVFNNIKAPLDSLASFMNVHGKGKSFNGLEISDVQLVGFLRSRGICTEKPDSEAYRNHLRFRSGFLKFITAFYDEREETEKEVWIAVNIPGARLSAAEKSGTKRSLSFHEVPG